MPSQYTVKSGDNLSKIANAHGLTLGELLKANPQFSQSGRDPRLIKPGEIVNIPDKSAFSKQANQKNGAAPCPNCTYWNKNHFIDYNGSDSKFVTSTQISAVDVAFRLDANFSSGNIMITSIFRWGTVAADVTDAQKADTITKFKAKAAGWGNRFKMKITDPICGEKILPIQFRLLWSPDDISDTASFRVNLYKTHSSANVTGWDINIGYDSDVIVDSAWTLAHEYGHTLCLPDEYFYAGVTSATVVYKKADGTNETVTLVPSTGNIMYIYNDNTYLKRFYYFTAIEAQELLQKESGRNVICKII